MIGCGSSDPFPGRPRITTRLLALVDLLNTVSAEPAVVTTLTELRSRTPDPSALRPYLSPDTDDETSAGLARRVRELNPTSPDITSWPRIERGPSGTFPL